MLINNLSILVFKRRVMLNGEKIFHTNQARFSLKHVLFSLKHVPTIKCKFLTYPHFIILPIFLLRGPKKKIIINITINKLTVDGCSLNVDLLVLCFFKDARIVLAGVKFLYFYIVTIYIYIVPLF